MIDVNVDATPNDLSRIRSLGDFDLKMFLSEVNDHGFDAAMRLLPMIEESGRRSGGAA